MVGIFCNLESPKRSGVIFVTASTPPRDIFGTLPGHPRDTPGTHPGHPRDTPGTHSGHFYTRNSHLDAAASDLQEEEPISYVSGFCQPELAWMWLKMHPCGTVCLHSWCARVKLGCFWSISAFSQNVAHGLSFFLHKFCFFELYLEVVLSDSQQLDVCAAASNPKSMKVRGRGMRCGPAYGSLCSHCLFDQSLSHYVCELCRHCVYHSKSQKDASVRTIA